MIMKRLTKTEIKKVFPVKKLDCGMFCVPVSYQYHFDDGTHTIKRDDSALFESRKQAKEFEKKQNRLKTGAII